MGPVPIQLIHFTYLYYNLIIFVFTIWIMNNSLLFCYDYITCYVSQNCRNFSWTVISKWLIPERDDEIGPYLNISEEMLLLYFTKEKKVYEDLKMFPEIKVSLSWKGCLKVDRQLRRIVLILPFVFSFLLC